MLYVKLVGEIYLRYPGEWYCGISDDDCVGGVECVTELYDFIGVVFVENEGYI